MNVRRLKLDLVVPLESSVSKIDVDVEIFPERRNVLALRYRVCADEGDADSRSLNEVGGFFIPAGNVVEIAGAFDSFKNRSDFGALSR